MSTGNTSSIQVVQQQRRGTDRLGTSYRVYLAKDGEALIILLCGGTRAARRIPQTLWPGAYRKLTMLDSAQWSEDLTAVPGERLEALAGDPSMKLATPR